MTRAAAGRHPLLLWGASGHGKVVLDIAISMACFDEVFFIDDAGHSPSGFCGHPVYPAGDYLSRPAGNPVPAFAVSIGRNGVRAACYQRALQHGLTPATLLHPSATIAKTAVIGSGTVVMARVAINPDACIGANCIINTAAVVEHDCRIGDHVHLSPGVLLAGGVTIGSYAHMGIGAIALPGAEIGERAVVGAGAVVLKSVSPGAVVAGVPARPLPRSNCRNSGDTA